MEWPEWWQWELELSPHLLERMIDRGFSEIELRQMLESATGYSQSFDLSRFVVASRHDGRVWNVIVEPDETEHQLIVVTAYPVG